MTILHTGMGFLVANIQGDKPISRYGTSKDGPTRIHTTCLNACKLPKQYTKEEQLLKILHGQNPTVPVLVGRKGGGASASPSNPKQGRSGKRKRSNAGHPSDEPTGAKKKFLIHGPGYSSEECKVLREYNEKRFTQLVYHDKQARSSSNKSGKIVKFESATEEANIMKSHDDIIPRKKEGKRQNNKSNSDQSNAGPSEDGRNYGLDRLNLVEPA